MEWFVPECSATLSSSMYSWRSSRCSVIALLLPEVDVQGQGHKENDDREDPRLLVPGLLPDLLLLGQAPHDAAQLRVGLGLGDEVDRDRDADAHEPGPYGAVHGGTHRAVKRDEVKDHAGNRPRNEPEEAAPARRAAPEHAEQERPEQRRQ